MTDRGYDPFSYGQLKSQERGATGGPAGGAPEDILFAGGASAVAARDAGDASDWDMPAAPANDLSGFDLGGEILGQAAAPARAAATAAPAPREARPAVVSPARTPKPASTDAMRATGAVRASTLRPPTAVPLLPPEPRRGSLLVPFLAIAAGSGAASWLYLARQNAVLAGISLALSLALGGIAWFGLRR